jgi:hypothetical protein
MISCTNRRIQDEDFREQYAEVIFGPKKEEGTGDWRKLHDEKLNDFPSSTNIISVIKCSCVGWLAWRLAERKMHTGF